MALNYNIASHDGVYRFSLDRRKPRGRYKADCQYCGGKKCFTLFVDRVTGKPLDGRFGKCDHINKCGMYVIPSGEDLGGVQIMTDVSKIKPEFIIQETPSCLSTEDVVPYIGNYEQNHLFRYLSGIFPEYDVMRAFLKYKVGTKDHYPIPNNENISWPGCCVYYQVDINGIVRVGKIMGYDQETGKRVKFKNGSAQVSWTHTAFSDYTLRQCLFGEHLLNQYPEDEVVNIVESEKTAIICSIENNKLFLATGGSQNYRQEVMEILYGRKIVVWPDKGGGYTHWLNKTNQNFPEYKIEVNDFLEKKDIFEGADMADYILDLKIKKRNKK